MIRAGGTNVSQRFRCRPLPVAPVAGPERVRDERPMAVAELAGALEVTARYPMTGDTSDVVHNRGA